MTSSIIHFILGDNSIMHGWFFPGDGYFEEGYDVMTTGPGAGEELS